MVGDGAKAATVVPVVSGYELEGVRIGHLIIDGNREHNPALDGCRGGGIFLYRGFGTVIEHCTVRGINGDGLSFQQSNDVLINERESENNAGLGPHPGSGSQHATIRKCVARNKGRNQEVPGIRIRGGTRDVLLRNTRIQDTRPPESRKRTTGIRREEKVGPLNLEGNTIETKILADDQRRDAGTNTKPDP
jgi:hypothetical protein